MNLELIKKYEKEFLHMLHGGKLKYFTGKEWLYYRSAEWTGDNDLQIVIDDMYLPYRTALAEGKKIQFFNTKDSLYDSSKPLDTWQDIDKIHTHGRLSDYRIKPEEPEFKVGDWITVNGPAGTFIECISGINDDTYTLGGTNICYKSQAIKWEPKEGDLCIVWNNDNINYTVIIKFDYIDASGKYSCSNTWWDNCMPFTGVLPPHTKDN